jgi:hypothetical protein
MLLTLLVLEALVMRLIGWAIWWSFWSGEVGVWCFFFFSETRRKVFLLFPVFTYMDCLNTTIS